MVFFSPYEFPKRLCCSAVEFLRFWSMIKHKKHHQISPNALRMKAQKDHGEKNINITKEFKWFGVGINSYPKTGTENHSKHFVSITMWDLLGVFFFKEKHSAGAMGTTHPINIPPTLCFFTEPLLNWKFLYYTPKFIAKN